MPKTLEYWLVVAAARTLGRMPRGLARLLAGMIAFAVYRAFGRLRRVGTRNLELALPVLTANERTGILRGVYVHLGWQLVEFCRMTRYTAENTAGWIRTEGLDDYLAAQARGKGVLVVTGHLGAWELSSFYHSLMGHPMGMVIRRLDNRRLDDFVNGIRCLHGNQVIHKDDFGRGLLLAMHSGQTVGILMDTNMTPPQGSFVKFFGLDACTATGLAHVARSCSGSGPRVDMSCTSGRRFKFLTRPTPRQISSPVPNSAPAPSNRGFGVILTSGYGSIVAGRPGRQSSRGCTRVEPLYALEFVQGCRSLTVASTLGGTGFVLRHP
jgi:KDO2-lipid IV(A) lauroyltransferase